MSSHAEVVIEENSTLLAVRGARLFDEIARKCVEDKGRFFVALSGGSTPRAMHRTLAKVPYRAEIPWHLVHLFWVDERCVPWDDPASNYGAAKEDFLEQIPLPAAQIHPMPVGIVAEDGALHYENELRRAFQSVEEQIPRFDLIFLGLGKDGHTASLFPVQPALDEVERLVVAVKGGDPDVPRLTMTFPILNRANVLVFMASGKDKAKMVKTIVENPGGPLPAQRIRPIRGRVIWLLDREAASLISRE